MTPCSPLPAAVGAAAAVIAQELSDSALAFWAAVFTQLGDSLALIAVQRSACPDSEKTQNKTGDA